MSLGVPGIIFNAAEPITDFFQELSTELPQLAQVTKMFVFIRSVNHMVWRCREFFFLVFSLFIIFVRPDFSKCIVYVIFVFQGIEF